MSQAIVLLFGLILGWAVAEVFAKWKTNRRDERLLGRLDLVFDNGRFKIFASESEGVIGGEYTIFLGGDLLCSRIKTGAASGSYELNYQIRDEPVYTSSLTPLAGC